MSEYYIAELRRCVIDMLCSGDACWTSTHTVYDSSEQVAMIGGAVCFSNCYLPHWILHLKRCEVHTMQWCVILSGM